MTEHNRIKITVLRRFSPSEVFQKSPATPTTTWTACPLYEDGQEFIIGKGLDMPEGFCKGAWNSLYGTINTLYYGGNFPWFKEKGVNINCCIDGLRPVVFKIERI